MNGLNGGAFFFILKHERPYNNGKMLFLRTEKRVRLPGKKKAIPRTNLRSSFGALCFNWLVCGLNPKVWVF